LPENIVWKIVTHDFRAGNKMQQINWFMQKNGGEIDRRFGAPAVFLLPPCNPQERLFSQIQENLKNG